MNDTFLVKLLVHVGVAGGKLRDAMRDFDVIQQPKVAFFALDIVQNGSASGRFNDGFCFFAISGHQSIADPMRRKLPGKSFVATGGLWVAQPNIFLCAVAIALGE